MTGSALPWNMCTVVASLAVSGSRAKRPAMETTRPARAGRSRVDSSAMMPPCEKPTSATASVPTPASRCQRATVSAKAGSAASTRSARFSSLMPFTENHWRPAPRSEGSGAAMLTMKASGNSAASTWPSGTRSCALAPTPWNSSINCWAGPSGRATMMDSDMAFSALICGTNPDWITRCLALPAPGLRRPWRRTARARPRTRPRGRPRSCPARPARSRRPCSTRCGGSGPGSAG